MAERQRFYEHELEDLDALAADNDVDPALLRALLDEQFRTRADGRSGFRAAVEALIDAAAADLTPRADPHAD